MRETRFGDAEALRDIFRNLGPIHIRRMFGGQGIYQGELMFALVAFDELYLKVDDESVAFFRDPLSCLRL